MSEKQLVLAESRQLNQHNITMGKKHIIKQTEEEILKEGEKIEAAVKKEARISPSAKIKEARIYISSSYNNTLITLTDIQGNVLSWASAGAVGFKGAKKSTPFAASKVAENIFQVIQKLGINKIAIFIKGIGSGRESAIRSLAAKGLEITSITDITPIPHNGCRPKKVRRV